MKKISIIVATQVFEITISFFLGMRFIEYKGAKSLIPTEESISEIIQSSPWMKIEYRGEGREWYFIDDREKIEEFASAIEFDDEKLPRANFFFPQENLIFSHCMCVGEYRISVNGNSFTLHHLEHLRWRMGPWGGDAPLNEASSEALKQWLVNNGIVMFEPAARCDAAR